MIEWTPVVAILIAAGITNRMNTVDQHDQSIPSATDGRQSPQTCSACHSDLTTDDRFNRFGVCSHCGQHYRIPAKQWVDILADPGSFDEFSHHLVSVDPLVFSDRLPYRRRVLEAREQTGLTEAAITGMARLRGQQVVLTVLDFRFLGGSMGSVVGEKVTMAFERAVEKKVPIITVAASGGARMQEGMLSLMQMAKTSAAAKRVHDSHIPFVSILTNPTTGGIYASFANQGDIILAEPNALIGFAGPRVIRETSGLNDVPSHTSEFLFQHGFVDEVVERTRMRDTLATILRMISARAPIGRDGKHLVTHPTQSDGAAWATVQIARHPDRPTALDYIRRINPQFVELHGDRNPVFRGPGAGDQQAARLTDGEPDLLHEVLVASGAARHGSSDQPDRADQRRVARECDRDPRHRATPAYGLRASGLGQRFGLGAVDREDLGQAGDPEDLEQPLLGADQSHRSVVRAHLLESADEHAETRGVEEVDLLHVDDKVVVAVADQLSDLVPEPGRRVDVDLSADLDDGVTILVTRLE